VTDRLTGKRSVTVAVAVPALVLLLAATRPWLTGRSAEPLLGGGAVSGTGSQVAPGVVALALVGLVALVTMLTGRAVVRRVSSVALVVTSAAALALTVRPLTDPEEALGRVAAATLGRTGVVRTTAEVSAWAWTAVVAGVVLVLAALLAAFAAPRWWGLSKRFDAPGDVAGDPGATPATPPAGAEADPDPHRSAWDDLTEGRDPTVDGSPPERRAT
jgi:uncharacterized membrane protein (TIGR02234 family)